MGKAKLAAPREDTWPSLPGTWRRTSVSSSFVVGGAMSRLVVDDVDFENGTTRSNGVERRTNELDVSVDKSRSRDILNTKATSLWLSFSIAFYLRTPIVPMRSVMQLLAVRGHGHHRSDVHSNSLVHFCLCAGSSGNTIKRCTLFPFDEIRGYHEQLCWSYNTVHHHFIWFSGCVFGPASNALKIKKELTFLFSLLMGLEEAIVFGNSNIKKRALPWIITRPFLLAVRWRHTTDGWPFFTWAIHFLSLSCLSFFCLTDSC